MEKNGVKVGQKLKKVRTLGTSYFRKNLDFPEIFQTLSSFPGILPMVQIS